MSQVKVEAVGDRVTIQEAARRLRIKDDAVRKRIQRGTIDYEKDPDGRVYVFLDKTHDMSEPSSQDEIRYPTGNSSQDITKDVSKDIFINDLQDQIQYLREIIETRDRELEIRTQELKRKDTIIMSLAQRLPELSSASSPEDLGSDDELLHSPGKGEDEKTFADPQVDSKRPWWKKLFGG